jgi:hypothetical protein
MIEKDAHFEKLIIICLFCVTVGTKYVSNFHGIFLNILNSKIPIIIETKIFDTPNLWSPL